MTASRDESERGTERAIGSIWHARIVSRPDPAGRVKVVLTDQPGCARCARGDGCQRLGAGTVRPLTLECRLPAQPVPGTPLIGRTVEIVVPDAQIDWLLPLGIGYGLPTATLVAGCVLVERLVGAAARADPVALAAASGLGGVVGLALGVSLSRRLLHRLARHGFARPCQDVLRIVSVVPTRSPSPIGAPVDDDAA